MGRWPSAGFVSTLSQGPAAKSWGAEAGRIGLGSYMQSGCFPQPKARPLGNLGPARHSAAFHPVQMSRHSTRQPCSQTCCPTSWARWTASHASGFSPHGPGALGPAYPPPSQGPAAGKQPHRHTSGTRPCPSQQPPQRPDRTNPSCPGPSPDSVTTS